MLKLIKHPRLIIWYLFMIPMTAVVIVLMIMSKIINFVGSFLIALNAVLEVVLFRYELWAKYNKPGELINCPWKKSLKQIFLENF